jgi:hypothetical protein
MINIGRDYEFPTLATLFPSFTRPADFLEAGGFCSSTFLDFERPTTFTALCVFSGCAGCRGGRAALSGSVSTASWTCISTSSYARRSQWNIDRHCILRMHGIGHMTHFAKKCNKYASTAKYESKSIWQGCVAAGYLNKCLPGCHKKIQSFPEMFEGCFQRHLRDELHVSRQPIINRAHQEYMLSRFAIPARVAQGTLTNLARPRLLQCPDP